jgi:hypothetical protein
VGIHAAVPLIAALANVVIWVATLSQGVSQRVIRIFSVLCLCVASWNLGMFSLYHFPGSGIGGVVEPHLPHGHDLRRAGRLPLRDRDGSG